MMDTIQDRARVLPKEMPRVGVPYRTSGEEAAGQHTKHEHYCQAIRVAGGEPVAISLRLGDAELTALLSSLDAFVLPGSPADIDPSVYGASRHPKCADADPARERTDRAVIAHAVAEQKPVLAICYGVQSLNVFFGGTLVQDIPSEVPGALLHSRAGMDRSAPDPMHQVNIAEGSTLAGLVAGAGEQNNSANTALVNSRHHQSVEKPGRGLLVTATAPDGVIEAVEWTGGKTATVEGKNWIVGVQWHPETMDGDALAAALFKALVRASTAVFPQAT